ncbi:MAG: hypothetical protein H7296_04845 [Bacteroidia bacterium]|nr:hypothetical protein [Bacteroidia bacterium]
MRKILIVILLLSAVYVKVNAAESNAPDTVKVGIYFISLHDIDFRQKEYTARFWLWFKYKNHAFDFAKNVEVPFAKSIEKSDNFNDTSDGEVFTLMKIKCVMKQAWKVHNYPFDKQKLEVHIENSQFDARSLVFIADTAGRHFDPLLTLNGWNISLVDITTSIRSYETTFGDETLNTPHSDYASFNTDIYIERNAWGLFFKLFLCMYVSFAISYICFFIHADSIESRFGLCVGSLFAAVGNKYVIDSILPESSSFTLVDSLHAFTYVSIFITISLAVHSLLMAKKNEMDKANKRDKKSARILLITYLLLNLIYIIKALQE